MMWKFLVDEDMPRSTERRLNEAGFFALDVRDIGLRSQPDASIFSFAQEHQTTIISRDVGFANILNYPLGSHAGIIVARLPNGTPPTLFNETLMSALKSLQGESLA
jgi:predicted nuclease of predicted toxin-antitoxin system